MSYTKNFDKDAWLSEKKKKKAEMNKLVLDNTSEFFSDEKALLKYFEFAGKFHRYSYGNQCLIFAANPNATDVASLKKWNGLGRKVKKGEHGIDIFVPSKFKKWVEKPVLDKDGKKTYDKDGNLVTKKVAVDGLDFKIGSVFDISQTESNGDSDSPDLSVHNEDPVFETEGDLKDALIKCGVTVTLDTVEGMLYEAAVKTGSSLKIDPLMAEAAAEASAYEIANYLCFDTGAFTTKEISSYIHGRTPEEMKALLDNAAVITKKFIAEMDSCLDNE